jgi:hypothetical protein
MHSHFSIKWRSMVSWTLCETHTDCWQILISWNWALLDKLPVVKLFKNFPAFYGIQRFITVFVRALHCSLSWARLIQSRPPHSTSLRSTLILSTHICLCLPSGLFPPGFPTKILHAVLVSPIHSTFPAHLILLDLLILTILGEE